jgi:hypothetical protein
MVEEGQGTRRTTAKYARKVPSHFARPACFGGRVVVQQQGRGYRRRRRRCKLFVSITWPGLILTPEPKTDVAKAAFLVLFRSCLGQILRAFMGNNWPNDSKRLDSHLSPITILTLSPPPVRCRIGHAGRIDNKTNSWSYVIFIRFCHPPNPMDPAGCALTHCRS